VNTRQLSTLGAILYDHTETKRDAGAAASVELDCEQEADVERGRSSLRIQENDEKSRGMCVRGAGGGWS